MAETIERYRSPTRILHWIHLCAFVLLGITGLILFIPQLGFLAQDSWTRLWHRIAAVFFVVVPIIYMLTNWKATWKGVKEAFTWGAEDLGWLRAAPLYYFLGDEKAMPPQGHMNTGQKMWWFIVLVFGAVFLLTGVLMWAFKTVLPPAVLQWSVFVHDVSFIVTGSMFFVHLYLSLIHPLMAGVYRSMLGDGKVTAEYAKSHHAKWYERISHGKGA